jgi:probable rRNA maturation factor
MAARSEAKLEFSCSATKAAAKKYPKWKSLIPLLEAAAHEVMRQELPEIKSMKLGIVLMSDEELLEMNRKVMKHDFYTDILTFEIERGKSALEAELYFSLDRASENALQYKVTLRNELARLVIHGMLHLAGYDDKKQSGKKRMREKERFFLERINVSLRGGL